jgi:amino acid adenylation domain-containing protein
MSDPRPWPGAEPWPLSAAQREVLLDQRAHPNSPHLLLGGCGLLRGPADDALLRAALHQLAQEQPALRLRGLDHQGQSLLPAAHEPPTPMVLAAEGLDAEALQQRLQALWRDWTQTPLDLQREPPWRVAWLCASPTLRGIVILFHHSVMDGFGTAQFMRRWAALYTALANGSAAPTEATEAYLEALRGPAHRSDHRTDHRSDHRIDHHAADAAYWQAEHTPLPPALFPALAAADAVPLACTASQALPRLRLDTWGHAALRHGQTAFATLLAATALHFARLHGVSDVVIGVPALNRGGRAHRQALGMYVGVMPLRLRIGAQTSTGALLAHVAHQLHAGLRHARHPGSELARDLHLLAQGRHNLFDVLLSFERQDYAHRFAEADLTDSQQLFSGRARFPLSLTVCDFGADRPLAFVAEGSVSRFDARGLELLLRRIAHIADQLAAPGDAGDTGAGAERPLSHITLLDATERHAVLEDPHRDLARHHPAPSFIERFDAQAALLPDAPALVWDGGSEPYAALAAHSLALAQRLAASSLGTDGAVIALALPRSPALVQAMLACARCGLAFMPLDTEAPDERQRVLLAGAQVAAVVCPPADAQRWHTLHGTVLPWQATDAPLAPSTPLPPYPAESCPAYVLFTSGSSGTPKPVVVPHGALARRLAWLARAWAIGPADRSLQGTQPTFDPALIELLLPLTQGGSVALAAPGRVAPASLAALAVRHGCTFTALVPTTLSRLLDGLEALPTAERARWRLRVACCGGEVLAPALAQRWLRSTGAALWNVYGPTEACIFAGAWACRTDEAPGPLPIGQPVDDTRLYVLDADRQPLPYGSEGELWIGGPGLALGYLHDAERSAQAFVPDPFVAQPGARMYRTGDRAWWDGQGRLQFAGRADRQLKLRGLRIEPAEIEAVLLAQPGVHEAHVQPVREGDGDATRWVLQAWLTPETAPLEAVQRAAQALLPIALVPSRWLCLPALPLTPQGKVDSAALPAAIQSAAPRAAQTPLETTLLALLRTALNQQAVGIDDDFFASGGDSLAALDWLSAIETHTGLRPSLAQLVAAPTVARLADVLGPAAAAAAPSTAVACQGAERLALPLSQAPGRPTLFLAASGHGDLLRFQALADTLQPQLALQMLQPPTALQDPSLQALAQAYAAHIAGVMAGQPAGSPVLLAGFSVGGVTALETARQLAQLGHAPQALVLIDSVFPRWLFRQPWLWRLMAGLSRSLYVQELTMNGRRLGAMFNDAGLLRQVLALQHYRVTPLAGPVTLLRTSGLSRWQRWLFGPWLQRLSPLLQVKEVQGMHGSIFEASRIGGLAQALLSVLPLAPTGGPHGD